MNGLALCAGVGAMELGLRIALGGRYRSVGYVEREGFPASILVDRMAQEVLDPAPLWDDLTTFDGRPYRGRVDLVSSGLPCQPYSVAGKMRGHDDERALWPHLVRIVRECEPALVFVENVPRFRKLFEPVWNELRGLGFEFAPPLLQTASESGAIHIRERFYALAAHPERVQLRLEPGWSGGTGGAESSESDGDGSDSADAHGARLEGRQCPDECAAGTLGGETPNADGERLEGEWCGWLFDLERQTFRHDADRCGPGCRIRGSLWDSVSPVVRVDARSSHWLDEIRAVGNVGAPPVAYARAFRRLARFFD